MAGTSTRGGPGTLARVSVASPGAGTVRTGWLAAAALGVVGVTLVVAGTFLPWVDSGSRSYNSYAVAGLADRLGVIRSGVLSGLLGMWPFIGPLCLVPLLLAALRLRRAAGWTALVLGVTTATAAALVLGYADSLRVPGVTVVGTGPSTVLAGGSVLAVAGVLALTVRPSRPG